MAEGHEMFFLTQHEEGVLHQHLRKYGVNCAAIPVKGIKPLRFIREFFYIRKFIRDNKIDIVFSHLGANLVSIWVQYFSKAVFYVTRHHTDEIRKYGNWKGRMGDKLVIRFGKNIVSICSNVTKHLLEEGCKPKKITEIPLSYDFSLYAKPNADTIDEIRKKYSARLLLVAVSRHVAPKRHALLISILDKLIHEEKLDLKCLILDQGPLTEELKKDVAQRNLNSNIFFIGYTDSVMDYISSADLVPHLSDSEASNSVIKEAGLMERTVAVCTEVGDFDDYIESGVNGFKMNKENPAPEMEAIIRKLYAEPSQVKELGSRLKKSVIDRFSIDVVYLKYKILFDKLEQEKLLAVNALS